MSLEKPSSWNAARDRNVLVISPDYMIAFILNYVYIYIFFFSRKYLVFYLIRYKPWCLFLWETCNFKRATSCSKESGSFASQPCLATCMHLMSLPGSVHHVPVPPLLCEASLVSVLPCPLVHSVAKDEAQWCTGRLKNNNDVISWSQKCTKLFRRVQGNKSFLICRKLCWRL